MASKRKPYERNIVSSLNNAKRTNVKKTKTSNSPQNCKYRLCADRDETISRIMRTYGKLAQKKV